jgi:hypothetical protein
LERASWRPARSGKAGYGRDGLDLLLVPQVLELYQQITAVLGDIRARVQQLLRTSNEIRRTSR